MSASDQKKLILPYLQRADEIGKMEPRVAYYCRMYAIDQGIAIPSRAPEITEVIKALMAKLEADKPRANLNPADDAAYCENFACTIFERADKVDRAGRADKNTAMTFYAASVFIEILRQFGELPSDMAERQRYAAWKAADIRKALREGRPPQAGPPVTEDNTLLPLPSADLPAQLDQMPDIADTRATSQPSAPPSSAAPRQPDPPIDFDAPAQPSARASPFTNRFRPGDKVLYCSGAAAPVRGTVAKVQSPAEGGPAYMVALSQHIVSAAEPELAHEFEPGTKVLFAPPNSRPAVATITGLDMGRWRPGYLISLQDGSVQETTDEHLRRQEHAPDSPIMPSSQPPPVSTSPTRGSPTAGTPFQPPPTAHGPSPPPFSRAPADFQAGQPPPQQGDHARASYPSAQPPHPPAPHQYDPGRPSAPPPPSMASAPSQPPPAMPAGAPQFSHPPGSISLAAITEAHKHAKYATSSLSFEDVASARKYLSEALRLISDPNAYQQTRK